jgi:hypothetical protein
LAATAGTDVFLSFSHSGTLSNPPGWGRVYADLGGAALSVEAFQDAVRAARTVVTNGPWLTLDVDGAGPGAVLERSHGELVSASARVQGRGPYTLSIVGPDGVLAEGTHDEVSIEIDTTDGPTWIAAIARGGPHPTTLDAAQLAHTSACFIDVDGQRVGRAADAQWCLDFLDDMETLVVDHGRYDAATRDARLADVVDVLDRARSYYRPIATGRTE